MANHPSSYAGLTRDGLLLALLDRLIDADGRKPDGNNPADRHYVTQSFAGDRARLATSEHTAPGASVSANSYR